MRRRHRRQRLRIRNLEQHVRMTRPWRAPADEILAAKLAPYLLAIGRLLGPFDPFAMLSDTFALSTMNAHHKPIAVSRWTPHILCA